MAFVNTPKWAASLLILDDWSPEKEQHGNDARRAGSAIDQLPTPPRFSPATPCVPALGALVMWWALFHWGFKHPWIERRDHMFRVGEIIDFWRCLYSFVLSLNWGYLYKHCLIGSSLPRSHYSRGLLLGVVLPLRGYLASGCIFFVIAGEGCCSWHLIGEGHDAVKYPPRHRTAPCAKTTQNVDSAEVQKALHYRKALANINL